jgi:hypothetical protein
MAATDETTHTDRSDASTPWPHPQRTAPSLLRAPVSRLRTPASPGLRQRIRPLMRRAREVPARPKAAVLPMTSA